MLKTFCVLLAIFAILNSVLSSSHSEAPGTAKQPQSDVTDFYMFQSYEPGREDYTVFIMNAQPLQNPFGGPNYFSLSDNHVYEIHIDNNGDAISDITLQFIYGNRLGGELETGTFTVDDDDCADSIETVNERHRSITLNIGGVDVAPALKLLGPVTVNDDGSINEGLLNWREFYMLNWIIGDDRDTEGDFEGTPVTDADTGDVEFRKPFDYSGTKGFPDYQNYANQHIFNINIPNCERNGRVFVGQRKESFNIALGNIFDLVNFVPIPDFPGDIGVKQCQENNDLGGLNIDSFIVEVPTECILGDSDIVGAWTSVKKLEHEGDEHIAGRQVSRLGQPLINELFIGLPDKHKFNAADPTQDGDFAVYVTNPTLPEILSILFKEAVGLGDLDTIAPTNIPRGDLVEVFLKGIPGVNQPDDVVPSEMLRLNTAIEPTPFNAQHSLGVLGNDLAGFPNGRRPGDDVVDIYLQAGMGFLCHANLGLCDPEDAVVGDVPFTDGAPQSALDFSTGFPFLRTPNPGAVFENRCAVVLPDDPDTGPNGDICPSPAPVFVPGPVQYVYVDDDGEPVNISPRSPLECSSSDASTIKFSFVLSVLFIIFLLF